MHAGVVCEEPLPGLYDVKLVISAGRDELVTRVLYMPDTREHVGDHGLCDPEPVVLQAERFVRERFHLCADHNIFDLLAKGSVPRFDAYDEVYGFAYALDVLVPFLKKGCLRELGEGFFDAQGASALLDVHAALEAVRPQSCVLGGQRRILCHLQDGRSYGNKPLEWICVAEQRNQFKQGQ